LWRNSTDIGKFPRSGSYMDDRRNFVLIGMPAEGFAAGRAGGTMSGR